MEDTRTFLYPELFTFKKKILLKTDEFTCSVFRYSTGVCAVHLSNSAGSIILLPFQGQQIWRAEFLGQACTMKSIFEEPENTTRFGLNYGGFLIHCGLSANGNPSKEDNYSLHGELPNALFQEAYLSLGKDDTGNYIALGGKYTYRNSLEYHYEFEPLVKLYSKSSNFQVDIEARNLRSKPMKYMYMAHINWLPIDGSRLVYSALKDKDHIEVYDDTFGMQVESGRFGEYVRRLIINPTISDLLDSKTQYYDPELCMFIKYEHDERKMAHAMQILPNGKAFYVGFKTDTLPNAVRWFARTGDEDAIAFAIPSITNHLGFAYNLKRNNIRDIPGHGKVSMHMEIGLLNSIETQEMEKHIQSIID